jgi:hypothetical protein
MKTKTYFASAQAKLGAAVRGLGAALVSAPIGAQVSNSNSLSAK